MFGFNKGKSVETRELVAVVTGKVKPLTDVCDEVFSKGLLGKGVAFEPEAEVVYAPCDGVDVLAGISLTLYP